MRQSNFKTRILLLGDASQVHLRRWESYLIQKGYDVFTASLEPIYRFKGASKRLHVPRLLPDFVRYPMAVPAVGRIIRRFRPDVVNAHFVANYGVIAGMTGFKPWILSTWGSDIMLLPERSPFHMYRTQRVIAAATYITSDAEVMSRRLLELGAKRDRVVTFPFGVDRDIFCSSEVVEPGKALRILSNRKLETVYNIETIVRAFPSVLKQEAGATLTIAGTGHLAPGLSAMAARTAPAASIHFLGSVPHQDMAALLQRHDIYVSMPISDTTSVSLLEAMACGLFPIVSDIPSNREWINHGENGFLVHVADDRGLGEAITAAWRNVGLRREAARRNHAIIEARADWQKNMSLFVELIERTVADAGGRGSPLT